MYNSILLHNSQRFYELTHQGKVYKCSRVSDIIEKTSETPIYLKMWMVNCAVEAFAQCPFDGVDIHSMKKIAWSAHQIKSQQALAIGTQVHGMINNNGQSIVSDEEAKACWASYQAFVKEYIPVPIAQEIALYDLKGLYAGTCDYIGLLGARKAISVEKKDTTQSSQYPSCAKHNTVYIIDWKTSKAINRNYKIQVTVYKHMILQLIKEFKKYPTRFDEKTTRILNDIILAAGKNPKFVCGIVRLPKKPSSRKPFEFVTITAQEEKAYLKEFQLMAKLHNLRTKETENGNANDKQSTL